MLPRIYRTQSEIRKRQINTLKVFNDNVVEVQEDSEYKLLFNAGGRDLVMHVQLGQDFPKEKPVLRVAPVVLHPWVNAKGEVTSAPGLLNFTVHSDLGRVAQAIIREFERTPPPLASDSGSSVSSPSVPMRIDGNSMGRVSPNYYHRQNFSPPVHNSPVPTTALYQSVAFPELAALSLDELQFLNESVERQDEYLDGLPQSRETNKIIEDLIVQIEELAESNLSKRTQLDVLRKDIDARIEQVTKLAFETERLNVTYQNLSDKYSPKNIKNQLMLAAQSANDECDAVAEAFLGGSVDVDKFVQEYLQKRTLGQTRKTKEEKLTQQLQDLERAGF